MTRSVLILLVLFGAVAAGPGDGGSERAASHWSFQPLRKTAPPAVGNLAWPTTAIDQFILARLEQSELSPSPPADRRTLVRRATFDLIGLPPTPADIDAFVNDPAPLREAFARVVDRLLDSPHFGERWGRYWLDVARYADTKGYIFTEERKFPYAYTYRDWVIRSLNEDLPYDQFLIQQIAADQLPLGDDKRPLAAMGFLTLGRRFLGNMHDIIDDRIDVVTRGTMALTVQCARCHDHKYDPIPTADYYSLYGVFASCSDKELAIAQATPEYERELHAREAEQNEFLESTLARTLHKLRTQVSEYLLAAESLKDHPDIQEFMFVENPGEINRFALGRWRTYLELQSRKHHPVWAPWFAFATIPEAEFGARAEEVARRVAGGVQREDRRAPDAEASRHGPEPANATDATLSGLSTSPINPCVARRFQGPPPHTIKEVAERYGGLFAEIEDDWQTLLAQAKSAGAAPPGKLDDPSREELRQVLYSADSPTAVPRRRVDDLFEKPDADKIRALRKKVQEWRTSAVAPPNAMALVDNESPMNPAVFVRGNPSQRGSTVPRQFLGVVAGPERQPFEQGSGRLELARAIASPDNPLTARVFVNRVWMHLFGAGLVRTPSDFGLRSEPPTHPELLDWLAASFVENGWSTKRLIRLIMTSSVYTQGSGFGVQGSELHQVLDVRSSGVAADPENRLLWRQNRKRLEFEALRDSLLAVTGDIDLTPSGPSVELAKEPFSRRRTVYGYIERQNLPGMFRTFDFASPDHHCPQRFATTVPQQALFLMNAPFVVEQARRLVARPDVQSQNDPMLRIQRLYRSALGRQATREELELGVEFVDSSRQGAASVGQASALQPITAWEQLAQVLLLSSEFMFVD